MSKKSYLDFKKTKSYRLMKSGDASFIFIQGGRGIGKTWSIMNNLVQEFIDNKRVIIKLCRNNYSIKPEAESCLEGVLPFFFPDYYTLIKTVGIFKFVYICKNKENPEDDDKPIHGWHIPCVAVVSLSAKNNLKSVSQSFNFIDRETKKHLPLSFYFDEYQTEDNKYLSDETDSFLSVFSTINRERDDTWCIFTSNSISILCPLHSSFGIDKLLSENGDVKFYHKPRTETSAGWCLQRLDSNEFKSEIQSFYMSPWKSKYSEMAIKNQFQDSTNFINNLDKLPYKREFSFITCDGNIYSLETIQSKSFNGVYISDRGSENDSILFSTSLNSHSANTIFSAYSKEYYIIQLRKLFENGNNIAFKNLQSKMAFIELIGYGGKK